MQKYKENTSAVEVTLKLCPHMMQFAAYVATKRYKSEWHSTTSATAVKKMLTTDLQIKNVQLRGIQLKVAANESTGYC